MISVAWLVLGCRTPPPEVPVEVPPPAPEAPAPERAPTVVYRLASDQGTTPSPVAAGDRALARDLSRIRDVLVSVVEDHGRDPDNPWAIGHAMLALGPEITLENDEPAVDWLFSAYAEVASIGDTPLIRFPPARGAIRIEPHTDLILKALTEGGITPDRRVTVEGQSLNVGALYRHSLWRAWTKGTQTGFQGNNFNDTPWSLQGLAAWAPPTLTWTASGGRPMTMNGFTSAVVETLTAETRTLTEAKAAGTTLQKDTRNGIFRYTCGGQHLLQGAAYAVGRGFGGEVEQAEICRQIDLLGWRIDVELNAIDPHIATGERPIQVVLLQQRLKFLGHTLETVHKIGAMGVCSLEGDRIAASQRVARELVDTVDRLADLGIFADLDAVRADTSLDKWRQGGSEQVYLDFVGDAAHAVRGIDLATGASTIRY